MKTGDLCGGLWRRETSVGVWKAQWGWWWGRHGTKGVFRGWQGGDRRQRSGGTEPCLGSSAVAGSFGGTWSGLGWTPWCRWDPPQSRSGGTPASGNLPRKKVNWHICAANPQVIILVLHFSIFFIFPPHSSTGLFLSHTSFFYHSRWKKEKKLPITNLHTLVNKQLKVNDIFLTMYVV